MRSGLEVVVKGMMTVFGGGRWCAARDAGTAPHGGRAQGAWRGRRSQVGCLWALVSLGCLGWWTALAYAQGEGMSPSEARDAEQIFLDALRDMGRSGSSGDSRLDVNIDELSRVYRGSRSRGGEDSYEPPRPRVRRAAAFRPRRPRPRVQARRPQTTWRRATPVRQTRPTVHARPRLKRHIMRTQIARRVRPLAPARPVFRPSHTSRLRQALAVRRVQQRRGRAVVRPFRRVQAVQAQRPQRPQALGFRGRWPGTTQRVQARTQGRRAQALHRVRRLQTHAVRVRPVTSARAALTPPRRQRLAGHRPIPLRRLAAPAPRGGRAMPPPPATRRTQPRPVRAEARPERPVLRPVVQTRPKQRVPASKVLVPARRTHSASPKTVRRPVKTQVPRAQRRTTHAPGRR